jgi:hypothetical protein
MADQGQHRRITARVSAAGETGCDNPSGQRLTALHPFPQCFPLLCPTAPLLRLCHAFLLPSSPRVLPKLFIDTIVHIGVLNDNLPLERLLIFQRFGVHPTPEGFIQWEVSPFVTFESKS